MSGGRMGRVAKELLEVLRSEGATIIAVDNRRRHYQITYGFGTSDTFITSLPKGTGSLEPRWTKNFRATIRRNKPKEN